MSSLLEEAIVDATALKDAALKNAESAVLEKYSTEVKKALDTLLEQDEMGLGGMSLGGEETPEADMSFVKEVPYAFQSPELNEAAEEELIEIDFNKLKERMALEEEEGIEASPDELLEAEEVAEELAEGDEELSEAGDPEGYVDVEDPAEQSVINPDSAGAMDAASLKSQARGRKEDDLDEDLDLSKEIMEALIEELTVDIKNVPQGWSSVNSSVTSQMSEEAALVDEIEEAQDKEEDEETVEEQDDPAADIELYESRIRKLSNSITDLKNLLREAKVQLEEMNLANAKLVYQNKALNSSSLNERQRSKIVEAVRHANSVGEAKVLFETIQNAVKTVGDGRRSPETLREAVSRPTSMLLNSKRNSEATKDPNMDRLLRLAGIKQ
jgi:hypothetical protein